MGENIMRSYIDLGHGAEPIAFYPYTSCTQDRIFTVNDYHKIPEIKLLRQELIDWFNKEGIKCEADNKIVFEVEIEDRRIFIGFHDWTFSIGFSVKHDSWIKPTMKGGDTK